MSSMADQLDGFVRYEAHEYRRRLLSRRLSEAFERALRNQSLSRSNLRPVVFQVIEYAVAAGESPEHAADVLLSFLAEHPRRDELDHISLIDGRRTSERLLDEVRSWLGRRLSRADEGAATTR
jgi:hypothetical protein